MKERPILFNGEMVRAILDGRKTQTRRVVKQQPEPTDNGWDLTPQFSKGCPYGIPGDRLWVRETFKYMDKERTRVCYRASPDTCDDGVFIRLGNWKPSIHMPRWASRITLAVTSVRVERVQSITEDDAMREGVWDGGSYTHDPQNPEPMRKMFAELWDNINAKRGYGWEVNPWVWIVEFRREE